MARITVEDCIDKFPSRFELVLIASNRARQLHSGENPTLDKDNDKNTVIALREIAEETLTTNDLKNNLIEEYQTATLSEDEEFDEPQIIDENIEDNNEDLLQSSDTGINSDNTVKNNNSADEKVTAEEKIEDLITEESVNSSLLDDETNNKQETDSNS